jgi:23S rRNA pseudouridine1911/1915/1917 synthase
MTHIPTDKEIGMRLDAFVAEREEITRSAIQKLIEKGNVRVNDSLSKKSYKIESGDVIEIDIPEPEEISVMPEEIALSVVYEDSDLIVVNKPKGMVVHPAPGNYSGTLVNALLWHCKGSLSGINGEIRPGIVHRIDKDTSGLLVVAKNDKAHNSLAAQIKEHSCLRTYEAVVVGNMKEDSGVVNAPIARHPYDRKKMAIVTGGREAVTHWEVINRYDGYTHLRLRLETGRTHQIRVHMSSIGHPVFCDEVYGGLHTKTEQLNASKINGQCLHARTLGFIHPTSGEEMRFESELPEYFSTLLTKLILK